MKTFLAIFFLLCFTTAFTQNWNQDQKIVPSDRAANDAYSFSSDIDGSRAIVGAMFEDENAIGNSTLSESGSAYIYEKNVSGQWIETQKIVASDRNNGDNFGYSVAISGDYIAVGAWKEDENSIGGSTKMDAGSVYIFERDASGVWNEVQKIVASDRAIQDLFGHTLSIDGNYLLVGALFEDEDENGMNTMTDSGSAYLFERDASGQWNEVQKIVSSDRASNDQFSYALSISGDYLTIGSPTEDEDELGMNTINSSGSAYIFERDGLGNWIEVQKIVASDRSDSDNFAYSIGISGDYIAVGSRRDDEDPSGMATLSNSGSAYIFERDGTGSWNEVQKIVASDREANDEFGSSISIDMNTIVVGAFSEDEDQFNSSTLNFAGSSYIYLRDVAGNWNEEQKIVPADREAGDYFGWKVNVSGNTILVSALYEEEDETGFNTISQAGSAYLFSTCSATLASITEQSCDTYVAPDGQVFNASGIYTSTIPNAEGCDSIITIDLTINIIDSAVTQIDAITLQASSLTGSYQWVDCDDNYSIMNGETSQYFVATANGNYALIVTENGCSDTSACLIINEVGLEEYLPNNKELVKIIDTMGREILPSKNTVLIYVFSDGTLERKFSIE